MFVIYLLRHGTVNLKKGTYYGVTDYELSDKGVFEVEVAANKLEHVKVDEIICSPLQRAIHSADIIKKQLYTDYHVDHLLIEKSFGIFEGLTYAEIKEKYPEEFSEWSKDYYNYEMPEGESARSLHERCIKMKNKLLKNKKNVLVIAHQGTIRYLISELLSLEKEEMWHFSIRNGKIAKIIVNDEGYAYLEV